MTQVSKTSYMCQCKGKNALDRQRIRARRKSIWKLKKNIELEQTLENYIQTELRRGSVGDITVAAEEEGQDIVKLFCENAVLRSAVQRLAKQEADKTADLLSLPTYEKSPKRITPSQLSMCGADPHMMQKEEQWAKRFKVLQHQKNTEIEFLRNKIAGRDNTIASLEDTARLQVDKIQVLLSEVEQLSGEIFRLQKKQMKRSRWTFCRTPDRSNDNDVVSATVQKVKTSSDEESTADVSTEESEALRLAKQDWLEQLKKIRREKNTEIECLQDKLSSRNAAITSMEQSTRIQLETIRSLQSQLDDVSSELSEMKKSGEERDALFEMQKDRLRNNSGTIAAMLKTIQCQNETMGTLRSEIKRLRLGAMLEEDLSECAEEKAPRPVGRHVGQEFLPPDFQLERVPSKAKIA